MESLDGHGLSLALGLEVRGPALVGCRIGDIARDGHRVETRIHVSPRDCLVSRHRPKLGGGEDCAPSGRDAHLGARAGTPVVEKDGVRAGREAELHALPARLCELHREGAALVADGQPTLDHLDDGQAGRSRAQVRQHQVARPGQADVVGRVLGAELRALRRGEGLLEREGVRLVQSHQAVAGGVRRPAQARDEEMRKERGADPVRLLGRLLRGARGEECVALHVRGGVEKEGGTGHPALCPCQRPRGARVEDRHAHVGGDVVDVAAEDVVHEAVGAEYQPVLVGVARVVHDELAALLHLA